MQERIRISQSLSLGGLWFGGWLFAIGYLKLGFFQGLIGLVSGPISLAHISPADGPGFPFAGRSAKPPPASGLPK